MTLTAMSAAEIRNDMILRHSTWPRTKHSARVTAVGAFKFLAVALDVDGEEAYPLYSPHGEWLRVDT